MNKVEREMLDILKELRQEYGAVSVKAEFEAEGTRTEELLRLIDLARRVDLKVGLKIGGCEAVRDLIESKNFGVEYIIAPMVETPYALKKFIEAKNNTYSEEQKQDTSFLFNIETITAFNNLDGLIETAKAANGVQGGVFGRVDFAGSNNLPRAAINDSGVTDYVITTARALKAAGLELVVGGSVDIGAIRELRRIRSVHLSRFETRKVIFDGAAIEKDTIIKGLQKTVNFELLWLKNKRDYYRTIHLEDEGRIKMLDERWNQIKAGMEV